MRGLKLLMKPALLLLLAISVLISGPGVGGGADDLEWEGSGLVLPAPAEGVEAKGRAPAVGCEVEIYTDNTDCVREGAIEPSPEGQGSWLQAQGTR